MNDSLTSSARADTSALIIEKRDAIVAERADVLERRAELLVRLRRLDRELSDCRAAARLFNLDIEFPPDERDEDRVALLRRQGAMQEAERLEMELRRRRNMAVHYSNISRAETLTPPVLPHRSAPAPIVEAIQENKQPPEVVVMHKERPPIRQVVLEQLQLAADRGRKATEIQEYIERTFGEPLHSKTVGMTLYRLSKDGIVRRDGHNWYFVPKGGTENPGATNAGAN